MNTNKATSNQMDETVETRAPAADQPAKKNEGRGRLIVRTGLKAGDGNLDVAACKG